jgi:hypothetical protein
MNNQINITYIASTDVNDIKTNIFLFCEKMNEFLTNLKLCHIFTNNYNTHKIYGKSYEDLSDILDTLQEEIVGISKFNLNNFVGCNVLNNLNFKIDFKESDNYIEDYKKIKCTFLSIFLSSEFSTFIENSQPSGIKNLIEEIYSIFNKTDYLLSMC